MIRPILQFLLFFLLYLTYNQTAGALPANLLTNPGAESGTSPWTTFGGGPALQASATQNHSGSYSFYITGRTQYYHGPNYNLKGFVTGGQLVSGERYSFSVWVRHAQATSQKLFLNIKKVDGSGTKYITIEDEDVAPNTWVKIEGHYLLAITGGLTSLDLYVVTSSGTTYSFYSDDFYLAGTEDYTPPVSSTQSDFVRASGKNLVAGASNTPVVMRGVNICIPTDATNTVDEIWAVKSVSEKDFQNVASMGFNAIRLLMYYKMFEDDAAPGIFKEDGWHWLDRAVSMAKDAGLKVLLDMHAPQGGYQSDKAIGFSAFWGTSTTDPNTDNQNRLIALWGALANRYKHETAIMGYDLINEPRPHNSEEWFSFAEQVIAQIRTVDANHLIVLEAPFIPGYYFRTVNDNNVLYDSHFYYTWGYVTQYSSAYGKAGQEWGRYEPENPVWVNSSEDIVPPGTANASPFDKSYLENVMVEDILDFAYNNNVPANVGEYGICWENFSEDVGAMRYLYDLDEIFYGDNSKGMNVSHFYFAYQYSTFGLYTNWFGFQPNETQVSTSLKSYFSNDFRWTGGSGTSWNTTGNWNVGIKPGPTNNVTIEPALNPPHVSGTTSSPSQCSNLTIMNGATLTIDAGKALTINGTLANNSGSGGLIVDSDINATGSLISNTSGIYATVKRYIGGTTDPNHGWHLLSSPVAGLNINTFHTPGSGDDFYKWDEPAGTWINRTASGGGLNGSFETDFVTGRGYLTARQNSTTHSFSGELHVEDVNISGLTNSGGSYSGWNLLANPFSSAIKFDQGNWNRVNIGTYPLIWNESSASYKVLSGNMIIPPMNGFMVYTNGNGSLTIPAGARVHSDSAWYKLSGDDNEIILSVLDPDGHTEQETIIGFNINATENFDLQYDCYFSAGFAPSFYSIAGSEKLALNSLPELNENLTIPLGFIKNGSNRFSLRLIQAPSGVTVYIFDLKEGVEHNLSQKLYDFSAEITDNSERFLIKFGQIGIDESSENENPGIWVYNNKLYCPGNNGFSGISIVDIMGRTVKSMNQVNTLQSEFPLNLTPGIYVIRLHEGEQIKYLKTLIE